ncbi:IS1634 family transposase [Faecalibaculum rodentium]|uniref:IS1634 family transposase n=1 Tax=Faecalibaculum rodentium TaxID=1702221 RepID=UPI0023F530C2|nr:IS1634 family transposase [Faecalibaculum rodentium]
MSIRLHHTQSKNSICYYIKEDFTDPITHKRSTRTHSCLGNLSSLMQKYSVSSREEVEAILKKEIAAMKVQSEDLISLQLSPSSLIPKDKYQDFNVGWLYPSKVLSMLGLTEISKVISERSRFQFSLEDILRSMVCARIIDPVSKRSSIDVIQHMYGCPAPQIHDVYHSLQVLARYRYEIESAIYQKSRNICHRINTVLYYDCTNFYFETEDEDDFRKYGKSKENRPNPILQYGLFMDAAGIPIADICFPGNKNESFSLSALEQTLEKDFQCSRFIVCADAALNGFDNKLYNDRKDNGAYIVTQPVKKLKNPEKDWVIDPHGWQVLGSDVLYDIEDLGPTVMINGSEVRTDSVVFYKDKWIETKKKSRQTGKLEVLREHLIASFSTKYQKYQYKIREAKIKRAEKLLKAPGKISRTSNQRDPRYYIKQTASESEGRLAGTSYELDEDKISEDRKLDGFYAVVTDLEDQEIGTVIEVNRHRWEIEECFRIMKSELKTRPVYVRREDAIQGHLLICFLALIVYRIIEQYLDHEYTVEEVMKTLQNQRIALIKEPVYHPAFSRTELTDKLAEIFGYQLAYEALTEKRLNKYVRNAKSKNMAQFVKDQKRR